MRNDKVAGFTLIELLTVVAIIGILSAAGVAGLQNAVYNNRVRGESLSLAAFFESVSAATRQRGDTLCVGISGHQLKSRYYVSGACGGTVLDSFELESGFAFYNASLSGLVSSAGFSGTASHWGTAPAIFYPKIGLNSVNGEGFLLARYISGDRYAAVVKNRTMNSFSAYWTHDGGATWEKL